MWSTNSVCATPTATASPATASIASRFARASPLPTFAVIGDMHGNLPALEAVLADLAVVKPDAIYFAGDFVNRGPESGAVVERAMALGLPAISGNHETWLAGLARGRHIPDTWGDLWWQPQRLAVA